MKRKALQIPTLILALGFETLAQPCPFAWEPVQRLSETPTANFTSWISVVGDTVHAMFHGGSFDPKLYYRRSTDNGKNWQPQVIIIGDSVRVQSSKRPFTASGAHVYAVWENINASGVTTSIKIRRSTNGGGTWLENQIIAVPPLVSATPMVAAVGSQAYVTIIRTVSGIWQYFLTSSENAGETWEPLRQITAVQQSHSHLGDILATRERLDLVFERGVPPSGREIAYMSSSDSGRTWSSEEVISTVDDYQAWEPRLAADDEGNVYVCWQDAKYGTVGGFAGTLLMRRSTDNGATWLPEQRISSIASAERSTLTATSNNLYAAWWDNRSGNLTPRVYARGSADFGTTWCDEHLVGDPTLVSSHPNLASEDGHVHLSLRINVDTLGPKVYYTRREIVTAVPDGGNQLPRQARLFAPYPNPFNSKTTIAFELPHRGEVRLRLYDILGREISVLATGAYDAGIHRVVYRAHTLASGTYFVGMDTGGRKEVKPILLLR